MRWSSTGRPVRDCSGGPLLEGRGGEGRGGEGRGEEGRGGEGRGGEGRRGEERRGEGRGGETAIAHVSNSLLYTHLASFHWA